ncbi:unnamed protein product [Ceutorhynchus assimilis]|uniref:SCP domain-containing protein n=1 Tax=Ceutorhynchus assimilis TaxID=467358 RepID=A0A9N9MN33_9CUCU|nr:unnamed protein product [Ceutorhynchus assimilis]
MNCSVNILFLVILSLGKLTVAEDNTSTKQATDWCERNCPKEDHIGCIHKNCYTLDSPCELAKIDENVILDTHNKLRNTFAKGEEKRQPSAGKAANMMYLNWDIYLEYLAACNLKPCAGMKHDQCHVTEKFSTAGQNLAWSSNKGDCAAQVPTMINNWYGEIVHIPQSEFDQIAEKYHKPEGKIIGHFTQVIWARTSHIGCAMARNKKECTFACNYGPSGNIRWGRIYEEGEPASKCPPGLLANYEFQALCGKKEPKQEPDSTLHSSQVQNHIVFLILPVTILFANM